MRTNPTAGAMLASQNDAFFLKNGSLVKAKVVEADGSRATLLIAGRNVKVSSDFSLKPNEVFLAEVIFSGGKIRLSRQNPPQAAPLAQNDAVAQAALSSFVTQGSKIDGKTMAKVAATAKKFGKKSEKAAEIASILAEKGVSPTESAVAYFLARFDGEADFDGASENDAQSGAPPSFLDEIFENATEILARKCGALTVFNHCAGKSAHWISLPFEAAQNGATFRGQMWILLDVAQKAAKKIKIFAKNSAQKFVFVVYYSRGILSRAYFSDEPAGREKTFSLAEIQAERDDSIWNDFFADDLPNLNRVFEA